MAPNSVCWNITSKCNDCCAFCYREKNSCELDFDEQKRVISKIADAGIKKLTFAGGEPLLVPGINDLILYAKEKGLLTSMTTNGILLEKKKEECSFLFRHLDWLTLSLDGPAEWIQSEMGRNSSHVKRVQAILAMACEDTERRCKIKVNTVVSKVNQRYIASMIELLMEYPVERWKLFQFTPVRGDAVKSQEKYEISDGEFQRIADEVRERTKDKPLILSISDQKNIESAYFVVFPNGDVRISDQHSDRVVGNVLKDEIQDIWENGGFKKELHEERTKCVLEKVFL